MNMKRFWAAGLAATMALSLTACGSGDNNASDNGGGGRGFQRPERRRSVL